MVCDVTVARFHLPVVTDRAALPIPADPLQDPLVDGFARRVRYLRISVTDRCNFRCSYCMPEDLGSEIAFSPRADVLSFEEIERVVGVFARFGVRKLRLTGGEPLVRKGIVDLVRRVRAVPGIEQVVMTTNGALLGELAAPLAGAGLSGVNVSLDTLDADRFRALSGRGELAPVLDGIAAARAAGLALKLNTVALRGENDDELVALCEHAWSVGAVPRFIEHMPMSAGALYAERAELSAAQIRAALETAVGPLTPTSAQAADAGPARYWRTSRGDIGIISAMTEHFCDDCNRVRLTATGALHACLGHDDAVSLRDVLRSGGSDDDLVAAIGASVTGKQAGHTFALDGTGAPQKHMIAIGG
ncbi:GTP 3',8-cyclase MoaA [soil metagenome]